VETSFRNNKLAKVLNSERELLRTYGQDNGRRIARRLQNIADAANLEELSKLPQTRVHQLVADRSEQLSVDVKHPYRLILACDHDEAPRKPDGGLDWARITKVQVIDIADTH
jgi:plasmid maintenance system killer protein